ncbi:hypothetical protein AG4045_017345, partial [Apium graveolens]
LDMFDHITAIIRGEIYGSKEDIAHLCAHGKQLVKNAFNYGVFQDFPAEDRREQEISKRPKPKKKVTKEDEAELMHPDGKGFRLMKYPTGKLLTWVIRHLILLMRDLRICEEVNLCSNL